MRLCETDTTAQASVFAVMGIAAFRDLCEASVGGLRVTASVVHERIHFKMYENIYKSLYYSMVKATQMRPAFAALPGNGRSMAPLSR